MQLKIAIKMAAFPWITRATRQERKNLFGKEWA
jgi:hypothetical protein